MIRRLIVLRHAHASGYDPGGDHARRLDEQGLAEADRVGQELTRTGWVPDHALISDAARARDTWAQVAFRLPREVPVVKTRALYGAGWTRLVEELLALPDAVETALVIGHNPGWEEVIEAAIGRPGWSLGTAHAGLLLGAGESWGAALRPAGWKVAGRLTP